MMLYKKIFLSNARCIILMISVLLFQHPDPLFASEAMKRCGLGDAYNRAEGCAAVINNRKSSENEKVTALDGRCWALNDLGRYQDALADCNSAITLNPRYSFAYNNRGVSLENSGKLTEALNSYQMAVKLNPSRTIFRDNYSRLSKVIASKSQASLVSNPPNQPQPSEVPGVFQASVGLPLVGRRVALVIGNTKYEAQSPLVNPANDASLIASSLRSAGFQEVIVKNDLNQNQLLRAIRDFAEVADKADWSVVYYAGHGMSYNGANYMIPVDAQLKADRDIDIEAVDVGKIYNAISGSKSLRLVILDMCRTNPFTKKMTRTLASRSIGRGLVAPSESEGGDYTVFAAKDGQESQDGEGKNSPFAEALAKRLLLPNTDITRIFAYVREDVMRVTNKQQQPFTYGSLPPADYFFVQK